jgi:large subunit ribosomal protein L25
MATITIEATHRDDRGKNKARRLRLTGHVPGVIYGGKSGAEAVTVSAKQVAAILRSQSGHNTIFKLKLPGSELNAMLKDWQVDPVRGALLHVDMMRIAMDVKMRVKIPVHTFGEPQGVKLEGGIFEMVTREVEIECLPGEIPEEFRVDVTEMTIGKQLRAGDIPLDPQKATLVTDPVRVIAHVVAPREEEEKPAEAVAVEGAPAEPEVIKKGKKEAEEGEEGAAEAKPEAKGKSEPKGKEK